MVTSVRERDDRKEEERHTPSECDPKPKEQDDGLLDEESDGSSGRLLEEILDGLGFELGRGTVSLVTRLFSESLGSVHEDLGASGLLEEDAFGDEEKTGSDHLITIRDSGAEVKRKSQSSDAHLAPRYE